MKIEFEKPILNKRAIEGGAQSKFREKPMNISLSITANTLTTPCQIRHQFLHILNDFSG